jgi:hypothetical protein
MTYGSAKIKKQKLEKNASLSTKNESYQPGRGKLLSKNSLGVLLKAPR